MKPPLLPATLAAILIASLSLPAIGWGQTAGPDQLPLPRAKPTPLPADTQATKEVQAPPPDAGVLERPAGRPGRAREPAGSPPDSTSKDSAGKESGKKEKKKEPPPPDGRCDQCGGGDCVRKECVPKMTEKEIKKVCWDSKCEDFCVPGPSVWCGKVCQKDDCGCWTHDLWKPTCAEVRTRVVPVRKETKRKVPAVEWKVEERCACCRRKAGNNALKPARDEALKSARDETLKPARDETLKSARDETLKPARDETLKPARDNSPQGGDAAAQGPAQSP